MAVTWQRVDDNLARLCVDGNVVAIVGRLVEAWAVKRTDGVIVAREASQYDAEAVAELMFTEPMS